MSKNSLNNRYTIEYIQPGAGAGTTNPVQSNNKIVIISVLLLSALGAAGFFLWDQGFINNSQQEVTNTVTPATKVAETAKELPAIPAQVTTNDESIKQDKKETVIAVKPITTAVKTVEKPVSPPKVTTKKAETQQNKPEKSAIVKPVTKVAEVIKKPSKPVKKVNRISYSGRTGEDIFLDKCSYCHGKSAGGDLKSIYPKLQGQNSAYLLLQLKRMRDGLRLNVNPAMYKIIQRMNDETLLKVSNHISDIPSDTSITAQEKLDTLTKQLSLAKQKNTQLESQLAKNLQLSNSLSNLYDEGKSDINETDQSFMKVIQGEKQRLDKVAKDEKLKKEVPQEPINDDMASSIVSQKTNPSNIDKTNTVEISTANQMDKIILEMSDTAPDSAPERVKNTVNLQNQFNQMATDDIIPETNFTKALVSEDEIRKNAVRSIKIRKGETLWGIAQRAYGNGFEYTKILEANPDLKKGKVVMLRIGQVIHVPM